MQARFQDMSSLVREYAVDLVGVCILAQPELTELYVPSLRDRVRVGSALQK